MLTSVLFIKKTAKDSGFTEAAKLWDKIFRIHKELEAMKWK
jgi:hypothetical protein